MKIKFLVFLLFVILSFKTIDASEPQTHYSTLWGWQGNTKGELGDGTKLLFRDLPIQLSPNNWIMVSGGYSHSLAIMEDSTLWAWGQNVFGAFGNGRTDSSNIPIKIGKENNWKFVSAGTNASFAIKSDGSLWAWGRNSNGELGDSSNNEKLTPVQIGKNVLGKVKYITGQLKVTAAITENSSLYIWGNGKFGAIGDGTYEQRNFPVQIGNSGEWLIVSCSGTHTIAIKTNGTLWAWGYNVWGELGDGTYISQNKPIQIGNDSDWVDVSCEHTANLALKTNGTLWAWGTNVFAELGDSTMVSKNYPIQVGKDKDWMIARSMRCNVEAIKTDGSFWYWGRIRNYETLKSDTIFVPTKMDHINNVIQLSRSSAGTYSLFLRNYLAKPAKIVTLPQGNVTSNSAEVGGKIFSAEGEKIYQRGFCYDLDLDPTISKDTTRNGIGLGEYHTTLTNLLPFTKYYVRAYVTTAAGEAYGETERIFTKLSTPILVYPQKSQIDVPLKATFKWKNDMNALKYNIQLSKYADFSKFELDTEVVDSTININDLELHYDYYWRVQTINGVYQSEWSEVNSFHTIKFLKQELFSPIENSINIPIDCQLKWSQNGQLSSYILQVSKNQDFTSFVLDTIISQSNYKY